VTDLETRRLARRLALSEVEFRRYYTYRLGNGDLSLREKSNYDCIFYEKDKGCTVYEDRPRQCRTWPFWGKNVETHQKWRSSARWCKGMNTGRLHPLNVIEELIANDGTSDPE
jgi:Fe-S-cluster containining protein